MRRDRAEDGERRPDVAPTARPDGDFQVRRYADTDEEGWVKCRALAFLGSRVLRPCATTRSSTTAVDRARRALGRRSRRADRRRVRARAGHGVLGARRTRRDDLEHRHHPDHQRRGIATACSRRQSGSPRAEGLVRLEAWTRDDPHVHAWYESRGFVAVESYSTSMSSSATVYATCSRSPRVCDR